MNTVKDSVFIPKITYRQYQNYQIYVPDCYQIAITPLDLYISLFFQRALSLVPRALFMCIIQGFCPRLVENFRQEKISLYFYPMCDSLSNRCSTNARSHEQMFANRCSKEYTQRVSVSSRREQRTITHSAQMSLFYIIRREKKS